MNRSRFLMLTPSGLEALGCEEVAELGPACQAQPAGSDLPGRVRVEGPGSFPWPALRLVSRVAREAGVVAAGSIEEFRSGLGAVDIPELESRASFRVTAHAAPGAELEAQAAARAAGAVFHLRYGTPVDLHGFALEIRLDIGSSRVVVSVELHRDPLDKRIKRAKNLRSAVKPTIAAGLVRLAGLQRGEGSLLDPTCGSGTIAVEAKTMNPALEVCASDWDEATAGIARATVANHGLDVDVRQVDGRELWPSWERCFSALVFNPPYGVRVGRRARIDQLYTGILGSAIEVLEPGGRIVVLTPRRQALEQAARAAGLQLLQALPLQIGELRPVAHVLSPR